MPETDLARKLLLKPGNSFLLLNPPREYAEAVASASSDVQQSASPDGRRFDLVQLFVSSRAELQARLADAIAAVKPGGVFWVTYPKQTAGIRTDINRDSLREAMRPTGWRPVTQIAVDETWSALRMRPEEEVGR